MCLAARSQDGLFMMIIMILFMLYITIIFMLYIIIGVKHQSPCTES